MSEQKAEVLYRSLRDLRGLIWQSDAKVLQLMAHPDATANQIMQMHDMMVRSRQGYRETHARTLEAVKRSYRWWDRIVELEL